MGRTNPFGLYSNNLPDAILGKNYDVVKKVYNNLDLLKSFMEDPHLDFLEENIEDIKSILNQSEDIHEIALNLEELLKTKNYASTAQSASDLAKQWAIKLVDPVEGEEYSSKYYALEASKTNEQIQEINTKLEPITEDLAEVANNIDSVKAIKNNIDTVNLIGDAVSGSGEKFIPPDLGMINSPDPELVNNSILVTLAYNLKKLSALYDNLEDLLDLNNFIKELPSEEDTILALDKINKALEEILQVQEKCKNLLQEAVNTVDGLDERLKSKANSYLELIKTQGNEQYQRLLDGLDSTQTFLDTAYSYTLECHDDRDRCNIILLEIRDLYTKFEDTIDSKVTEYTQKFEDLLDQTLNNDVPAFIQTELEKAKNDFNTYTSELKTTILNDINTTKDSSLAEIAQNLSKAITTITDNSQNAVTSINTNKDNAITDINNISDQRKNEITVAGSEQVDLAKKEVAKAQELVDSLRPVDWNATEGNQAILNKPDVYTKEEINTKLSGVYKFKGSLPSQTNLPIDNNIIGDVYNIEDTGMNYAWDGSAWDPLASIYDFTLFTKYTTYSDNSNRYTIQLKNNDTITGTSTSGSRINLITLDNNDLINIGSSEYSINLNAKDAKIYINDTEVVATLKNLEDLKSDTISNLTITSTEEKPLEESIQKNKLYGYNSTTGSFTDTNSEISSIIVAENLDNTSISDIPLATAMVFKQNNLL